MCLLVILHKVDAEYPLIVASNRDEDPGRGGEAPAARGGGIVAPRDPRAGGTWIGVNAHGVLSAVTNRAGAAATGQVNSRGTLPMEALKEKTAFQAHRRAGRIPTFVYSPFNWVYADREDAFAMEHGGPSDITVRLRPGAHVLTNVHDLSRTNAEAVAKFLNIDPETTGVDALFLKLKKLLGVHESFFSPDHVICKHEGLPRTVSANLIAVHATERRKTRWLYHEGPPCKDEWRDVSELSYVA